MSVDPKIQAAYNAEVTKTNMSMEAQREIQEAINSGAVTNISHLKTLISLAGSLTGKLKGVSKEMTAQEKLTQNIADNEYKMIDFASKLQGKIKGNEKDFKKIGDHAFDTSFNLRQQYKTQLKNHQITKAEYKELVKASITTTQIAQSMQKIAASDLAVPFDEAISLADSMGDKIEGVFSSIPGGSYLFKALGGDELKEQLKGAVVKGFAKMAMAMAAGATPLQALRAGMIAFNAAVMANPMILVVAAIAAAAAALVGLVMLASNHEKEARKLSETMGTTVGQSKQLILQAKQATSAMGNQLSMAEDILAVQQESAAAFGTMAMLTTDQAAQVSEIGKSFGYSAQQAGKVNTAFMAMGVTADEAADTQRDLAAEALKAGVNVGAVTADIAENSKSTAKYFGGNVKALKSAAIEAAKMGVSLATMAKVSDSLLNFQDSISAQFELQAMTGKNMNFDLARQLALEGNIAGATAAVLEEVGSIHDFNKMDVLERKKLADATGMDVDELQKSLTIKSKLGDLTNEELASMNALGLSAAQMSNMSSEELQTKLAQQQSSEKMATQMAAMKSQLMTALLPLGEAFMGVFVALSPILKVIGGVFSMIGAAIKGFLMPIQFVFSVFTKIKDAISGILESMGILGPITDALGFAFDLIKNTIMYAGMILGTVFLPNIVMAGVAAVTSAAGYIGSAIGAIFTGLAPIPFIGVGLAIAAVAGLLGTVSSYMNDGVISPQAGGSGYGKRVLHGPEGSISFNNKDTIVAGTDLNYGNDVVSKANDAIFRPAGTIKMNDGVVGPNTGPTEVDVLKLPGEGGGDRAGGMSPESIVKLSTAIGIANGIAFTGAFGMIMPLVAGSFVGAMAMSMPIIATAITGAIIAGAAATALIPKPVLILNPVLPTFETNPVMLMGSMLGGIADIFGSDKEETKTKEEAVTMKDVIAAISNIEINLDGKKVSSGVRIADSFRL